MICEIVCVGTELLTGNTINTNASYIAKKMMGLGIDMYHQVVVGDNPKRLTDAILTAINRSDLVITSGGLGPTYDDLTKETICKALGKDLVLNKDAEANLKEYFSRKNQTMPEINLKQAFMPSDATPIPNQNGTAEGIIIPCKGNKRLIMLPGPPSELIPMMENFVLPMLQKEQKKIIVCRNINTIGIGESRIAQFLKYYSENMSNPSVATYVNNNEVIIRITANAENEEEAQELIDKVEEEIRKIVPSEFIYGVNLSSIEEAVISLLISKNLKIATAESCTGGLVSKRLTDINGASKVFECGVCSYGSNIKEKLLSVKTVNEFGAVSRETAIEMAKGVLQISNADIAVSTTGNAGPDTSENKPVGLVFVGIATKNKSYAIEFNLAKGTANQRNNIRTAAASLALYNAYKTALSL
ncbi:MAG: competence/damage-inducible protein A [Oscillospiraceae bacterium]